MLAEYVSFVFRSLIPLTPLAARRQRHLATLFHVAQVAADSGRMDDRERSSQRSQRLSEADAVGQERFDSISVFGMSIVQRQPAIY